MILGTAGYMSPEQARGKPVDKRADIWAFGVVLFEMLTGKTTFEGETVSDTLAAVLRADIDWKQLPAGTPPKVRRLLQRCLERDPKQRLRDIGDAWIEIDAPDEPAAGPVAPAPPARQGMWWLPWAAAVVSRRRGLGWGLLHRPRPNRARWCAGPIRRRAISEFRCSPVTARAWPSRNSTGKHPLIVADDGPGGSQSRCPAPTISCFRSSLRTASGSPPSRLVGTEAEEDPGHRRHGYHAGRRSGPFGRDLGRRRHHRLQRRQRSDAHLEFRRNGANAAHA